MTNISNFSFTELTKTDTGIKNVPDDMNVLSNLCRLAAFLQTIRNELHLPIIINSAYRSPEVNAKVGGVSSSYHVRGLAADICCSDMDKLLAVLHSHLLECDQIGIYYSKTTQLWFHVGIPEEGSLPRNQIFTKEVNV